MALYSDQELIEALPLRWAAAVCHARSNASELWTASRWREEALPAAPCFEKVETLLDLQVLMFCQMLQGDLRWRREVKHPTAAILKIVEDIRFGKFSKDERRQPFVQYHPLVAVEAHTDFDEYDSEGTPVSVVGFHVYHKYPEDSVTIMDSAAFYLKLA